MFKTCHRIYFIPRTPSLSGQKQIMIWFKKATSLQVWSTSTKGLGNHSCFDGQDPPKRPYEWEILHHFPFCGASYLGEWKCPHINKPCCEPPTCCFQTDRLRTRHTRLPKSSNLTNQLWICWSVSSLPYASEVQSVAFNWPIFLHQSCVWSLSRVNSHVGL